MAPSQELGECSAWPGGHRVTPRAFFAALTTALLLLAPGAISPGLAVIYAPFLATLPGHLVGHTAVGR